MTLSSSPTIHHGVHFSIEETSPNWYIPGENVWTGIRQTTIINYKVCAGYLQEDIRATKPKGSSVQNPVYDFSRCLRTSRFILKNTQKMNSFGGSELWTYMPLSHSLIFGHIYIWPPSICDPLNGETGRNIVNHGRDSTNKAYEKPKRFMQSFNNLLLPYTHIITCSAPRQPYRCSLFSFHYCNIQ